MPVMSVAEFERFFRAAASLDVDKNDLKRYSDFVNQNPGIAGNRPSSPLARSGPSSAW